MVEPFVIQHRDYSTSVRFSLFDFISGQNKSDVEHAADNNSGNIVDSDTTVESKYVLVILPEKKCANKYVGIVVRDDKNANESQIIFLRKCTIRSSNNSGSSTFTAPGQDDKGWISNENIAEVLVFVEGRPVPFVKWLKV